ncbi:hypothetical protein [Neobacillus drentensis]|uniref:hypothetical protein n=1 Tax=Neobacillus drentensis TaxID=220684 RepID=UPI002FFE430E
MVDLFEHDDYFRDLEEKRQLSLGRITTAEIETNFARQKFMIAICYEAPECLESLKQLFKGNQSLLTSLLSRTENAFPAAIKKISPYNEGKELHQLLINWSIDWNIHEDWMIENGLIALLSWYHKPELREELYWYNTPERHAHAIIRAIHLKKRMEMDPEFTKSYDPFIHGSKKEYEQLNKAHKGIENKLLAKYGLKLTKVKKDQRHFEWLVYYQLLKMSKEQIAQMLVDKNAEYKNIEPDSIKKAIKATSKLIGIKI